MATQLGPYGRLYQIDPRLRPTGKSGPLAVSLAEFGRYFAEGQGQLWERQALCKARVVFAPLAAAEKARRAVDEAAFGPAWQAFGHRRGGRNAAPARSRRAAGQSEARAGRAGRHRVPGADLAAQIRPRASRPARDRHARRLDGAGRGRLAARRRLSSTSSRAIAFCGRFKSACG